MKINLKYVDNRALILFALTSIFFSGCGSNGDGSALPPATPEAVSNIPFLTKEPEAFQATVTAESFVNGESMYSRVYSIAKRGTEISLIVDPGEVTEKTFLILSDGRDVVLNKRSRSYRELPKGTAKTDDLARELTSGWLSILPGTRYERLDTVKGITSYRVEMEGAENSKTLVFYDEELKLPVKTEIFSAIGGEERLSFRMEIRDLEKKADESRFGIPKGYRKAD